MPELQYRSPLGREARIVNMAELGKALTALDSPPVKAMVVYNSNPAAIAPNQNLVLKGMRREDLFTVVLEQFADRHRRLRRHPAAFHHVSGTHRSLSRLRTLPSATGSAGGAGAGRNAIQRGSLSRTRRAHGL